MDREELESLLIDYRYHYAQFSKATDIFEDWSHWGRMSESEAKLLAEFDRLNAEIERLKAKEE